MYIYNLSNKKVCVYIYVCKYNKKACVCIYIYMCESCLDKYINVVTWPPKQKIPGSALENSSP